MTKMLKKTTGSIYFLLAALEGIVATLFLAQLPSDAGQGFLFGFSAQRLILILGNLAIVFFFLFLSHYSWKNPQLRKELKTRLSQTKISFIFLLGLNIAGIFLVILAFLLPEYRLSSYAGYFERLHPTLIWFALIYLQTGLLFLIYRFKDCNFWGNKKFSNTRPFMVFFLLILAILAFIIGSGFGINADDRFWNEAGVPLLNGQIFITILITILFLYFSTRTIKKAQLHGVFSFIHQKQDVIIFIILWVITAVLWINEPLPRNFFAPGPYPPNYELSPYADPAIFDIGGQFSLIGQGLFNDGFYNRPLLSGFLAFLHLAIGQKYLSVVALQTAIFALFVPILYLIGKELHSRSTGIFLAFLVIFKNLNAIASSTWILSVHTKYMLTEFATAIILALFTLWFMRWQKSDSEKTPFIILAGGALGLGIMLRTNILFFLLFVPFLIKLKRNWAKTLRVSLIFILAFFITISPWMWRSQKVAHKPIFFLDIITEVIRTRYSLDVGADADVGVEVDEVPASHSDLGLLFPSKQVERRKAMSISPNATFTSPPPFIPNHFFHNIITSTFILPTSIIFHDLKHTINEIFPYWHKIDAPISFSSKIILLWNFFLLALGLSVAWKKWRVAGLLPLFVFLIYHLSNAFARTSGGRYLVPVDWVILLYYALAIVEIIFFIAIFLGFENTTKEFLIRKRTFSYKKNFLFILPFFLFVSSITILDQAPPLRYPKAASAQIQEEILQGKFFAKSGISTEEFERFLKNPNSRILVGRSLYPRFYPIGAGEHSKGKDAFEDKDFPRLTFTMIGEFGQTGVILPMAEPSVYFPNTADIILIGCQHSPQGYLFPYIDALMIVLLDDDQEIIHMRQPETSLQCPLSEPICDGNRNCR